MLLKFWVFDNLSSMAPLLLRYTLSNFIVQHWFTFDDTEAFEVFRESNSEFCFFGIKLEDIRS